MDYKSKYKTAEDLRELAQEIHVRDLECTKTEIMDRMLDCAVKGGKFVLVDFKDYPVSMLEGWTNIYNWLLKLGYRVEDRSLDGFYIVFW